MKTTNALKELITEDQILEVLESVLDGRKLEACNLLKGFMWDKWNLTDLEANNFVQKLAQEWIK